MFCNEYAGKLNHDSLKDLLPVDFENDGGFNAHNVIHLSIKCTGFQTDFH